MTTYTEVFGGSLIAPAQYSYRALTLTANSTLQWPVETNTGDNRTADIMDVTSNNSAFVLSLPAANLVGEGQSIIFNNVGANSFILANNTGTTLATVTAGSVWVVYLTDNSTAAGVWRVFQFGASVSVVNAVALAGYGLTAISTTLNQSMPVTTINSTYGAGAADRASVILWTGATGTLTLPSPATVGSNWFINLRNSGTNTLTVTPSTGQIDGAASLALATGQSCVVFTDGTNYFTIGRGQSSAISYTYLSINVAGTGNYTLSAAEQSKSFYKFTGVLTGNRNIIVPTTTAQYIIDNSTTGAFTLTVKTAAGAGVTVNQGSRAVVYCDGTDVLDGDTGGIASPVSIADGGTGSTTASGARTNLGATSVGNSLFTAADATAARTAISAVPTGDITTSGLTLTDNRLVGRSAGSAGQVGAITIGSGLLLSGGTLSSTAGGGSVTSVQVSGGTTGLTFSGGPITGSGTITMAGTLGVANGGTGATASTGSGNVVLATSPTITTPTITFRDNALTITDQTDTSKVGVFELSSLTTGTTRTLTWPDASGTIVVSTRSISTTSPLSGGGDLSANRTLSITTNGIDNTLLAQMATQRLKGRNTAGTGNAEDITITNALDWLGSTQGQILYRGASNWTILAPGSANDLLISGGPAANPSWSTPATISEFRSSAANKIPNVANIWSAADYVTLTDAATVSVDLNSGINFTLTLTAGVGATRTIGNPTNTKNGQTGVLRIIQPSSAAPYTVSWAANWEFASATAPTLSTGNSDEDVFVYVVISSTRIVVAPFAQDIS